MSGLHQSIEISTTDGDSLVKVAIEGVNGRVQSIKLDAAQAHEAVCLLIAALNELGEASRKAKFFLAASVVPTGNANLEHTHRWEWESASLSYRCIDCGKEAATPIKYPYYPHPATL